jgi:hypothetical protein
MTIDFSVNDLLFLSNGLKLLETATKTEYNQAGGIVQQEIKEVELKQIRNLSHRIEMKIQQFQQRR